MRLGFRQLKDPAELVPQRLQNRRLVAQLPAAGPCASPALYGAWL